MGINRIRLQNGAMGDPRVDARMQQTYQENIAANQAQQARNEGILQAAANRLFPEGNFQQIRANAPDQATYNIDATADLVRNNPFGIIGEVAAPALTAATSVPYDVIQGIGRAVDQSDVDTSPYGSIVDDTEIPTGPSLLDLSQAIDAENPLSSALERTIGAATPLAERISGQDYSPNYLEATTPTPDTSTNLQAGVLPGFTKLKNPDGAPGNYNEFMYKGPDGQIYGSETYGAIAAGRYPDIYDPSKQTLASGGRVGFQDGSPEEMIKAQEAAASDPALDAIRQQLFGEDYVQDIGEGRGIAQYYTGFGLPQSLQFTPPVVEEAAPVVDVTQPVVDTGEGGGQDLTTTPITTTPITTTPTIDGEGITPDDTFIGGGATLEDAGGVPDLGGVYATDYQGEGVGNLADYPINTGYGTNPATGQPYQTPRTIADQNAVLGQTFDEQKDPSFWENARDTFNETGQDIGNFFTRAKDQGIDFAKMAGTTILNLAGKAVMGVPLLGTALSLIGGGLPPRDPRQTALEELYDVGDGTIQSGLMAGYNPVSGNPLDPTFGLQDAYQDRIDNIENTLQDKYNMTDQEIADLYAGSYTGDVDTNLLDDVVELKDMKEKEKSRLDLFSGDVDERDQMLEDISLQNKIDAGIAAADEEPAPSGDGPQGVDAGTADIQDFADVYDPPAPAPAPAPAPNYGPYSSGSGSGNGGGGGANIGGGQQTSSGGPGGFSSGSGGWGWAKGGIVSLKNAKR